MERGMIALVPVGDVDEGLLESLGAPLEEIFSQKIRIADKIQLPKGSWHRNRGQYLASSILAVLPPPSSSADRVLGIIDVDLFAQGLNFVFGQADVAGRRAVISVYRLRQEFYGLPHDEDIFRQRALKEAVHELGHTYGLGHFPNPECVMHFSNTLSDTDLKGWKFCSVCQRRMEV
jgi:archaemetzincin